MSRQFNRISIPVEALLESVSGKREARISDLSLGGCFIDSIASVQAGEKLNIRLRLSEDDWLELRGEIAYALPGFGFGIRFLDLSESETLSLEELILAKGGTIDRKQP